jgi:hypothetical protein
MMEERFPNATQEQKDRWRAAEARCTQLELLEVRFRETLEKAQENMRVCKDALAEAYNELANAAVDYEEDTK